MTRAAFRVYPNHIALPYARYDRSRPLEADVVDFDLTGEFNVAEYAFEPLVPRIMCFHFNMLFAGVPASTYLTPLFFIRRVGGAWGELAGTDKVVTDSAGTAQNQGGMIQRIVKLNAGDAVRAHPCQAGYPVALSLTNAVNGSEATCNYFEGFEIGC